MLRLAHKDICDFPFLSRKRILISWKLSHKTTNIFPLNLSWVTLSLPLSVCLSLFHTHTHTHTRMLYVLFVGFQFKYWCTSESAGCTLYHRAQSSVVSWFICLCICFAHYVTLTYIYFLTCLLNNNVFRNPTFIFPERVTCEMYIQAFVIVYRLLEWPIDPLLFHRLHLFSCTIWRQLSVSGIPFYRPTLVLFWPFVCALP